MKVKLDSLPASTDKYWEGAEVNRHEPSEPKKCEHNFVRKNGTEVICSKCPVGFIVTPDIDLQDGHLYKNETLMI